MKKRSKNKDATSSAEDKDVAESELRALRDEVEDLRAYKAQREKEDAARAASLHNRGAQFIHERYRGEMIMPGQRLYLTADKTRLVPEGHAEARTLYCTEHQAVPRQQFERLIADADAE